MVDVNSDIRHLFTTVFTPRICVSTILCLAVRRFRWKRALKVWALDVSSLRKDYRMIIYDDEFCWVIPLAFALLLYSRRWWNFEMKTNILLLTKHYKLEIMQRNIRINATFWIILMLWLANDENVHSIKSVKTTKIPKILNQMNEICDCINAWNWSSIERACARNPKN